VVSRTGFARSAPRLDRNARFYLAFVLDSQWVLPETQKCPGSGNGGQESDTLRNRRSTSGRRSERRAIPRLRNSFS